MSAPAGVTGAWHVVLDDVPGLVREEYARAGALLGCEPPPLVLDPGARNAFSDGAVVGLNLNWMRRAVDVQGADPDRRRAVVLGILAHELGHHLDPDRSPDRWMRERYADSVAGLVLARAGLDHEPMLAVLRVLPFSPNHPPIDERRVYLDIGRRLAGR